MAVSDPDIFNPYTPAEYIEYTKPRIPYCWTPEPVVNTAYGPSGPEGTPN